MGWLTIQVGPREVHVLPCDVHHRPAMGHEPRMTCFCVPTALRNGPLDDPVWSHHEPAWPGANPERLH